MRELRRAGFSDAMIEALRGEKVEPGEPAYKLVDTCAAEFEAATPYYYSCWEEETESRPVDARTALVIGSGPIRIGQGIEFDYCSVHAAWALREAGVRAVLVNSNPETVSTDFDTSDRLYFDPLDLDGALHVARVENVARRAGPVRRPDGDQPRRAAERARRGRSWARAWRRSTSPKTGARSPRPSTRSACRSRSVARRRRSRRLW